MTMTEHYQFVDAAKQARPLGVGEQAEHDSAVRTFWRGEAAGYAGKPRIVPDGLAGELAAIWLDGFDDGATRRLSDLWEHEHDANGSA